ncbi:hypothetical protein CD175_05465 [Pseudomonas laurylsulfatiphila]|uniref:Uncharacterized protein n=1 Tax=Pseudomonas laurylsulfatiphila TaxID=2011015 RepID=A0A2S6FTZ1_9PSED|nr:hypothetical protein CD175_05465 [Pseudomonas laurylsulfatiphila]
MGASLLAKAMCQTPLMSTDTPSSRAGSLPQWYLSTCFSALHLSPDPLIFPACIRFIGTTRPCACCLLMRMPIDEC